MVELSLDEAEFRVGIKCPPRRNGKRRRNIFRYRPVLILHATLSYLLASIQHVVDYVLPPAVLYGTTAADLSSSMMLRLSDIITSLRNAARLAFAMHHDAAPACIRAGTLFRILQQAKAHTDAFVFILRVVCQIHAMMLALYAVNSHTKHIGPLFCATSLLHRGNINDAFRAELEPVVRALLDDVFEEPTPEEQQHMDGIIELLRFERGIKLANPDSAVDNDIVDAEFERGADMLRLYFIRDGRLRHSERLSCCHGYDDAVAQLISALDILLYDRLPPLPALNKWLHQFHPTVSWLVGIVLGTTPKMFFLSQGRKTRGGNFELSAEQLMGGERQPSSQAHQHQPQSQNQQTAPRTAQG